MNLARTCIGCRSSDSRAALLRFVVRDGRVVVDSAAVLPGRGAWVHPDRGCLTMAIRRRAFGRALRITITDTADLEEQAERHMDN